MSRWASLEQGALAPRPRSPGRSWGASGLPSGPRAPCPRGPFRASLRPPRALRASSKCLCVLGEPLGLQRVLRSPRWGGVRIGTRVRVGGRGERRPAGGPERLGGGPRREPGEARRRGERHELGPRRVGGGGARDEEEDVDARDHEPRGHQHRQDDGRVEEPGRVRQRQAARQRARKARARAAAAAGRAGRAGGRSARSLGAPAGRARGRAAGRAAWAARGARGAGPGAWARGTPGMPPPRRRPPWPATGVPGTRGRRRGRSPGSWAA